MKERGIIMSGQNPIKILNGRKTQTRRRDGLHEINANPDRWVQCEAFPDGQFLFYEKPEAESKTIPIVKCPYGVVGDRLVMRETWKVASNWGDCAPRNLPLAMTREDVRYLADGDTDLSGKTRVSIHMPFRFSRATLEITSVRSERVQSISEEDAEAEGGPKILGFDNGKTKAGWQTYREWYRDLWMLLHGESSWDLNEWVWVLGLKKLN